MQSGLSYRDLSNGTTKKPRMLSATKYISKGAVEQGTGISVSSMFNTIKTLKEKIKIKFKDHENIKRVKKATPKHQGNLN